MEFIQLQVGCNSNRKAITAAWDAAAAAGSSAIVAGIVAAAAGSTLAVITLL